MNKDIDWRSKTERQKNWRSEFKYWLNHLKGDDVYSKTQYPILLKVYSEVEDDYPGMLDYLSSLKASADYSTDEGRATASICDSILWILV